MGESQDHQFFPSPRVKEGQGGGVNVGQAGIRLIGPPSRGDRSRFLLEKNSDAAPADGSDRGVII